MLVATRTPGITNTQPCAHQPDRTVMSNPRDAILPLIPGLRAYARRLSGGDLHLADDVVQDTIVLALHAWNQFTPGTNLKGWLLRIAHNRFYNLVPQHVTAEIRHDDLASLASVSAEQEQRIELPDFKRAFAALHPSHREVLGLIVIQELTYKEAARVCGCEAGTVKSRMSRARAVLKQTFLSQPGPSVERLRPKEQADASGHGVARARRGSGSGCSGSAGPRGTRYALALLRTATSATPAPGSAPRSGKDDHMSGAPGLAALSICELMLLSLTDTGVIDDDEAKAILEDAATAHRNAADEVDGYGEDHREAAAIIEAIIIGGNSVRHRRRDSGGAAPAPR